MLGLVGGCAAVRSLAAPNCTSPNSGALTLAAQSVPTASQVPCIADLPPGWDLASSHIRSGNTTFTLDSDRAGHGALKVTLTRSCDISGTTEVPSDETGTRRYERINSVDRGFKATRTYTFPGGCVTYRLRFNQRGQALVNEASVAVGLVSRHDVDARLRADGHQHL
jgi:hypothetical protein